MEKGIYTNEQEKKLAQLVDDAINADGIVEIGDGLAARIIISLIDDQGLDRLPDTIKRPLRMVVCAVMDENVARAEILAKELSEQLIDTQVLIPGIDEASKNMLVTGAVYMIVGAVNAWVQKYKAANTDAKE